MDRFALTNSRAARDAGEKVIGAIPGPMDGAGMARIRPSILAGTGTLAEAWPRAKKTEADWMRGEEVERWFVTTCAGASPAVEPTEEVLHPVVLPVELALHFAVGPAWEAVAGTEFFKLLARVVIVEGFTIKPHGAPLASIWPCGHRPIKFASGFSPQRSALDGFAIPSQLRISSECTALLASPLLLLGGSGPSRFPRMKSSSFTMMFFSAADYVVQGIIVLLIFVHPWFLRPGQGGRAFGFPFVLICAWGFWRVFYFDPAIHNDIPGIGYFVAAIPYSLIA